MRKPNCNIHLLNPSFLSSFSSVKNELMPSHPLELSEKNVSLQFLFSILLLFDNKNFWKVQIVIMSFDSFSSCSDSVLD